MSSLAVHRFAGPEAEELALLWRRKGGPCDAAAQAEAAYRELAKELAARGASFRDLASETIFARDIGRDLPVVLDVRERVLSELGELERAPLPGFVGQSPVDPGARFELAARAVVPRHPAVGSVSDLRAAPSCDCEGCARSGARVLRLGSRTTFSTSNVYGTGADAFEQAVDAFGEADRLLARCGMAFGHVVRTWIHLRDIARDYDALNAARRAFFRRAGIAIAPASTGVQGAPFPDAHDVSIRLLAVQASSPIGVAPMSSPTLNEACSYGADFSRGLRVEDANAVTLHVSGTASIDEAGHTVHPGDFGGQVDRMLHNVASLLAEQGATFADVTSGVIYLVDSGDAPALRAICGERGFDGFPCALVQAPLCRPELLCEAEAVAMLPRSTARG